MDEVETDEDEIILPAEPKRLRVHFRGVKMGVPGISPGVGRNSKGPVPNRHRDYKDTSALSDLNQVQNLKP